MLENRNISEKMGFGALVSGLRNSRNIHIKISPVLTIHQADKHPSTYTTLTVNTNKNIIENLPKTKKNTF